MTYSGRTGTRRASTAWTGSTWTTLSTPYILDCTTRWTYKSTIRKDSQQHVCLSLSLLLSVQVLLTFGGRCAFPVTICFDIYMRLKSDVSQLSLPHGTENLKNHKNNEEHLNTETGMLRRNGVVERSWSQSWRRKRADGRKDLWNWGIKSGVKTLLITLRYITYKIYKAPLYGIYVKNLSV